MGMETVKLNSQCKLCGLLLRYPALWERAHCMFLQEGATMAATMDYLNGEVAKLNSALPETKVLSVFSRLNLGTHFKSHVPDVTTMEDVLAGNYTFNNRENPRGRTFDTSMLQGSLLNSPVDDFSRMHQLVEASFNRLADFDRGLREPNPDGSSKELDLSSIQLFQKLIKEAMQMKKELSLLQNSSNIAGEALHECVGALVRVAMDDLKKVLADAKLNLSRELPGSSLPSETVSMVLTALGKTFTSTVPEILEAIEKRYKIK